MNIDWAALFRSILAFFFNKSEKNEAQEKSDDAAVTKLEQANDRVKKATRDSSNSDDVAIDRLRDGTA